MNIVFLTADEPLYLPTFFTYVLKERAQDTKAIFVVPPRYGRDSTCRMAWKYFTAFGTVNLCKLVWKTLRVKFCDRLGIGHSYERFGSIKTLAASYGIDCELIPDVNDKAFLDRLRELKTDLIVSVSCPQIFRKPLITLPPLGCLNMHGAILPQYRGIAPSFWMMVNDEKRAGVTIFLINEDIDAGDVVEVEEFDIDSDETLEQFIIRSKAIAAQTLLRAIRKMEGGSPETTPLNKDAGSYYGFPSRQAYRQFRQRGRKLW